ncbi:predicted protein [Botrytis cinerea T4]|uniref:Uncharacterized protein n=1 Tax=Botryotinia fuckeliana (strain T4) TaxID=999810 RepID=G2Y1L2_BOTF4|nr:predicted protein [Botrytis cinerea T4]
MTSSNYFGVSGPFLAQQMGPSKLSMFLSTCKGESRLFKL